MITILLESTMILLIVMFIFDLLTGFKMIKSVLNKLRLKADNAAEALRDPEADAHAALADIRNKKAEMVNLRKEILLAKRKAESNKQRFDAEVARYEALAVLAGKALNGDDVRLALSKKSVAQKKVDDANKEYQRLTVQEDTLEAKINEFDVLIENAESNKDYLSSQLKINHFTTSINEVLSKGGEATSALEQLEQDVENSRIEAEVSGELSTDTKGLEAKYKTPAGISDEDVSKYLPK